MIQPVPTRALLCSVEARSHDHAMAGSPSGTHVDRLRPRSLCPSASRALLPRWAEAGGRDSLQARIADAATREKILAEIRENLRRRGGDGTLLLINGPGGFGSVN